MIDNKFKDSYFYIIGHMNPDTDSIVSASILTSIFKSMGYNCDYTILGEVQELDIINDIMEFKPSKYKNGLFFLVDHNDPSQSVNNNIIGCIDHHPNCQKLNNAYIDDYCSCALYIYSLFKDSYSFSDDEKKQIYVATLMDSKFGKSIRYKEKDKLLVNELGNYNFDELFNKYFHETDDNYNNGYKLLTINNKKINSSYIERLNTDGLDNFKIFVLNKDNYLGIWFDYTNSITYCFLNCNKFYEFKFDYIASRSSDILKKASELI